MEQREIKFRAWIKKGELGFDVNEMAHHDTHILLGWKWEGDTDMVLMQFTGLKDKNGKEIYEGDIIQSRQGLQDKKEAGEKYMGSVRFRNGSFYISGNGLFSSINLSDIDGNNCVNRCWHGTSLANRNNIYELLEKYTQNDRNKMLFQFMYYIHNNLPEYNKIVEEDKLRDRTINSINPDPDVWFRSIKVN